jgi:hypothetical protein
LRRGEYDSGGGERNKGVEQPHGTVGPESEFRSSIVS